MEISIKQIFDEISSEPGSNKKMEILGKYKDNELLKSVLYSANSKRIKFYIKQIPEYESINNNYISLQDGLDKLSNISNRFVTGHEALNFLREILTNLNTDDAYIIERIIDKDCKIGMGTSNINKVFPNLIEKTPYMGAISFDEKKAKKIFENDGVGYSQLKMDGRYANAIIRGNEVDLESRQGEPTILTGAKFLKELSTFNDCVLNGELTMGPTISRYESNGIIASLIDIQSKRDERTESETLKKIKNFESKHMPLQEALDLIIFTIWDYIRVEDYFNMSSDIPY